jgi:hypothetical protein
MVSALPSRTARRSFCWFWLVKVDPGRLVYRDRTAWSLSSPHAESGPDSWELGWKKERLEDLHTTLAESPTYRCQQDHGLIVVGVSQGSLFDLLAGGQGDGGRCERPKYCLSEHLLTVCCKLVGGGRNRRADDEIDVVHYFVGRRGLRGDVVGGLPPRRFRRRMYIRHRPSGCLLWTEAEEGVKLSTPVV